MTRIRSRYDRRRLIGALMVCFSAASAQQRRTAPSVAVSQVPDDAFKAMYSSDQRAGLEFFNAGFSPDGRYLAVVIGDIVTGDPEQVWRYELAPRQLIAITPKPNDELFPQIDKIGWAGDVLYTSATLGAVPAKPVSFRTEGNITSRVESLPDNLQVPEDNHADVPGQMREPETLEVENPSAVVVMDPKGFYILDIHSRRRQAFRLPSFNDLFAAERTPTGIRIAYAATGSCMLSPSADNAATYRHTATELCIADISSPAPTRSVPSAPRK